MRLYLIRHAQSVNNANPTHLRVEDPDLTELGKLQRERLGEAAGKLKLTHLFTSPFRRTLETTESVRRVTGLTPHVRSDLFEIGGCYRGYEGAVIEGRPGMNREEIEAAFPHVVVGDDIDETGWWKCRPREEHADAVTRADRVLRHFRDLVASSNARVALVMHADFKRVLLERFHRDALAVPTNTSISTIDFTSGEPQLTDFNNAAHLTPELQSW